ncbi:flavohemoglobin expression-modulating QEGLA motif protein [Thiosulfativibrio zosterae]|uniref:N-formylglutamate amidohydrolase n=1 Tax=Thiosulfativibrio zosterae TaxID=2675053 RepID=A0A6F8PPK6_9GAMM|nr:flavohemoglobin expression-modulating QEGLA motif protein [Thiosulfativibrio zosterae]BBP43968.1 N-formylglutamate amidohydrolase [Thiosulfativibrio zosterae]
MINLTIKECVKAIEKGELFHALVDGMFELKIEDYGFFICTAIHDGHQLRPDLLEKCQLTESERLYEEDPFTGEMISSLPITLIGKDSRYEYDLNRAPENCVYKEAWGKQVWAQPLSIEEEGASQLKHSRFYKVLGALIKKLEKLHGSCLVYDLHSYNHLRMNQDTPPPTFNIGTEQLNKVRWGRVIKHWNKSLAMVTLPNLVSRSAENEVFFGRGYLATYVKKHFVHTLVLPTEVKKVFMNELSGEAYPLVLNPLKAALKEIILANALFFSKHFSPETRHHRTQLLSSKIEPAVLKLDQKLHKLARGIQTLGYINPRNIITEKKRFFESGGSYTPQFTYRQLEINPFEFREKLYRLPESQVTDVSIQQMYRDVIDTYATKIDLLTTVGTEKFLYNSLRYYGEPSDDDIQMAHFLLYAKPYEESQERTIDAKQAKQHFLAALDDYQIQCKVEVTDKIIASAMVDNGRKTIMINKSMRMNQIEIDALIHHELGVHMVTTMNAEQQDLKVFKLGLPGNTYTQEGLAILSEYMTGNMNLPRLKTLAMRVIAVKMMVSHYDFGHTYKTLMNDYGIDKDEAFRLTARVYRGGGFTKDFLYLRGVKDALQYYKKESLEGLYVGKTSFAYLKTINEMIERGMVQKPTHLPMYMQKDMNVKHNPILEYLMHSSHPSHLVF